MRRTSGRCSRRSCIRHWKSSLRSEGARVRKCDGPVRWSDGPVRWSDGAVRWWDGLTFGPQYPGPRTWGPRTGPSHAALSTHRTASVSSPRGRMSITSGSTRPVCRRGLDENDHDDRNLSAGGDCGPIGDRASTVRRGDGAGCEGPVRWSEGPVRWSEGRSNSQSDRPTFVPHRRTIAPSLHRTVRGAFPWRTECERHRRRPWSRARVMRLN